MPSTSPVESPSTTDHTLVARQLPARGSEPGPVEAVLRMLSVAAADVGGALDRGGSHDPPQEGDPEYIRKTLPALRLLSSVYFRADVRGLDNIPAAGPVLLVGN